MAANITKSKVSKHVPPDGNMQYHLRSILTQKIKPEFDHLQLTFRGWKNMLNDIRRMQSTNDRLVKYKCMT